MNHMERRIKILVVDDEGIVLYSCRRVLEEEGFEVVSVTSADAALEAIGKEEFPLLLLDLKMPEKDGMYLLKKVKKEMPDLPVIMMTGYHVRKTVEEAVRIGARAFIAKPFTPDELLEEVRQVIS